MYDVTPHIENRLVRVVFTGFPDQSELERCFVEIRAAALKVKARRSCFDLLVDLREAAVLSSDRAEAVQNEIAWQSENGLRKAAILVSSALVKLQVMRMFSDQSVSYFTDENEAFQWLEN